jgi:hypothetical protein
MLPPAVASISWDFKEIVLAICEKYWNFADNVVSFRENLGGSMKVRLDGIYRKFEIEQRPVWSDGNSYPSNRDDWSYRRWAWEFLRRNTAYQEACKKIDREPHWLASFQAEGSKPGRSNGGMLPDLHRNAEVANKFGRCDLKSSAEEYREEEDGERLWLSETVTQVQPWRAPGSEIRMDLESGQVAIIFDLNRCIESGQAAKSSLLAHAKEILDRELETYDETLPAAEQSKIIRVRRDKLFLWLRLYDAIEHFEAGREEVAEILYKDRLKGPSISRSHRMLDVRKRISADLKRAKEMVESGYLGLVPLDSIQERSSRHK